MSEHARLLEMFHPPTYEEWRKEVDKQLKGASFEKKLVKQTYESIDIQPMYFEKDMSGLPHMGTFPGSSPFVRGAKATGAVINPWLISQEICCQDPVEFNNIIKHVILRGQTALNILLDVATLSGLNPAQSTQGDVGRGGLSIATIDDVAKALDGIDLGELPLFLQAGASGLAITALICAYMRKSRIPTEKLTGCIAADPLGVLSVNGTLPLSIEGAYREMAQLTLWAKDNAPALRTIAVFGQPYRDGGGNAVEELAFVLATAVEYICEMQSRGLLIDDIAQRIAFSFSVGSDFFMEIAKLRAARLLWDKIVGAFGGNNDSKRMFMHARTSRWNKTVTDPYVNMLRVTTEAFSAICGGCDSMHVGAFDELIRQPDEFSGRIARNVQIILKNESHFDKVIDPAGGCWYVETITDSVAKSVWKLFQEIEKKGGMFEALKQGFPQERIAETYAKHKKNIALRKDVFVGTNKYPNLLEKSLEPVQIDYNAFYEKRKSEVEEHISSIDSQKLKAASERVDKVAGEITSDLMEEAVCANLSGASLGQITQIARSGDSSETTIDPIQIERGAYMFETLRRAADAYAEKTGARPKIFPANMGPIPQHKARTDFSRDFFSVGGFEIIDNDGFLDIDDAFNAAIKSGSKIVVICSADAAYPDIVPPLSKKIKAANQDITVIVAGYPKDYVDTFKKAGVDDFIHVRSNVYEILIKLQKKLGIIL